VTAPGPSRERRQACTGLALEATHDAQAVLAALVESSDDAIIGMTPDGIVTSWNGAAEQLFGFSAAAMIGRPRTLIVPEAYCAAESDVLARIAAGERVPVREAVRRHMDGRAIDVAVSVSPIRDSNGALIGASEIARDVSEQKRLQRELRMLVEQLAQARDAAHAAKTQAERASQAKTDFLSTMSHEIRTPMNAILGLAYLALQGGIDAQQRDYVEKIHGATENLLGIVNGILDFSKVEAGKLQLNREPFDLRQMLESVIDTAGVSAHAKGLDIRLEVDPQVPQRVDGDAMRLGQVLLNLCDNAVKFTTRGHVLVQVDRVSLIGTQVELLFCVGDTGSGIPDSKQRMIFEEFAQADASTAREHGGSGLGLAISRKLVELMGGTAGVHSQVGSGSTFHFTARFGVCAAVAQDAAESDAPPPVVDASMLSALRGAKVLLAEDNDVNQIIARQLLEQVDIEVLVAGNGREALALLREHGDVDLVLMDCLMPVMDGFAATRAIRFDKRLSTLPVLAMTANVLPDDIASCRGAGMNDHIGKPIQVREFYAMLAHWLAPGGPGGRRQRGLAQSIDVV
jgi:PAS domain S-box-containing protein